MGFFSKIFEKTKDAVSNEKTLVMKKEKTVLTPEELEELRNRPVGMQAFGYRRSDGMDDFYLNKGEKEEADLAAARERIDRAA